MPEKTELSNVVRTQGLEMKTIRMHERKIVLDQIQITLSATLKLLSVSDWNLTYTQETKMS